MDQNDQHIAVGKPVLFERGGVLDLFIGAVLQQEFLEGFRAGVEAGVPAGVQHRFEDRLHGGHGAGFADDGDQVAFLHLRGVANQNVSEFV